METSDLNWGSVPDYLVLFGIVGGIIVGTRTWLRDRREQREQDARSRREQLTGAAMVVAYCIPPARTSNLQRALYCYVKTLSGKAVFDVDLTLRYVGQSILVPSDLREFRLETSVLINDDEARILIEAERWPEITYHISDFSWELEFTDLLGKRWRRLPRGMPSPIE